MVSTALDNSPEEITLDAGGSTETVSARPLPWAGRVLHARVRVGLAARRLHAGDVRCQL